MNFRLEVCYRPPLVDPRAVTLLHDIQEAGVSGIHMVTIVDVYLVDAPWSATEVERACRDLLCDHVLQDWRMDRHFFDAATVPLFEVTRKTGVMDPVIGSIEKGIRDLGLPAARLQRATQYVFDAKPAPAQWQYI